MFLVALPTLLTVFLITRPWRSPGGCAAGAAARLDPSVAVARADGAGGRIVTGDARTRWVRRAHQHELRNERDDPQHLLGVDGAFPPIFGGVVIMHFAVAYEMWPRITGAIAVEAAGTLATMAVVHRHVDHHDPLARRR